MAGKKTQPFEIHEDRRKYPRIVVDCPLEIRFGGKTLAARIYDLSPDGLQIRCDRDTLKAIRPGGKFIQRNESMLVDVSFTLAIGRARRTIEASVKMYYFVLLPEEKERGVAIGVQFASFKDRSDKYVEEFIMDALAPVESRILELLDKPLSSAQIADQINVPPREVGKTLAKLLDAGNIVAFGSGETRKHIRLGAAIGELYDTVVQLEKRLSRLEEKSSRKPN